MKQTNSTIFSDINQEIIIAKMSTGKTVVTTKNAPGPAPHNSQAIFSNGPLIFVSGQTGIDVATKKLVEGPIKNRVVSYSYSLGDKDKKLTKLARHLMQHGNYPQGRRK